MMNFEEMIVKVRFSGKEATRARKKVSKQKERKIEKYYEQKKKKERRSSIKPIRFNDSKIESIEIIQKEYDEYANVEAEIESALIKAHEEAYEKVEDQYVKEHEDVGACACCGKIICDFAEEYLQQQVKLELLKNKKLRFGFN